ncbi:peroxiredoxin family protein [Geodermatophilus normandii]|uniref:peroxiredoxin family protein n=1 Tax=Geodermatophilus normandii TaxID=1137989 RepID=UPI001952D16D|nr:hypothetical protein [Geodermatophilus normandii]
MVAYTQVATISTDDHHRTQEFRASVGATWTLLSDPGRIVQRDLDIREYTDPEHDPMIPHTLVLRPGSVVHTVYNGYWFWAARRSTTCGAICARPPPRSARTGTSPRPACGRPGTPGLVAVPRVGPARASSRRCGARGPPGVGGVRAAGARAG